MFKPIARILAVGGLAVGMLAVYAPPSFAATASPALPAHPVLAQVGSDTTYWVMAGSDKTQGPAPRKPSLGLSDEWNNHVKVNLGSGKVALNSGANSSTVVEVSPFLNAPFPVTSPGHFTVAGDSDCPGGSDYQGTGSLDPPGGSGAGQTALKNDATSGSPGCVDFSRSSSGLPGVDPNEEFVAYGIDGLDWVTFPGNTHKVKNLTPATIQSIYTCNATSHIPFIRYWDQIPGGVGHNQIIKYSPQVKAGTYSFFKSKYLGGNDVDTGCAGGPSLAAFHQEHDATGVPTAQFCSQNPSVHPDDTSIGRPGAVDAGDSSCVDTSTEKDAIDVFSSAQWTAQKSGVLVDLRNNTVLQKVNGLKPGKSTLNETPNRFFGSRYVYNVLYNQGKTGSGGSEPEYQATVAFAGVTPTTIGYVCSYYTSGAKQLGSAAKVIKKFGFVPLPVGDSGTGLPASTCRVDPSPAL